MSTLLLKSTRYHEPVCINKFIVGALQCIWGRLSARPGKKRNLSFRRLRRYLKEISVFPLCKSPLFSKFWPRLLLECWSHPILPAHATADASQSGFWSRCTSESILFQQRPAAVMTAVRCNQTRLFFALIARNFFNFLVRTVQKAFFWQARAKMFDFFTVS